MGYGGSGYRERKRKPWRYPGVPIPYRLQWTYYDPLARRR